MNKHSQAEFDHEFHKIVDTDSIDVTQLIFKEEDQPRVDAMYDKLIESGYSHEDILIMLGYGDFSNEI